ncbi:MAG: endolytic transglycosylase MltG [Pseudomonadota bacterium]
MWFLKSLIALVIIAVILGLAAAGGGWVWLQNELSRAGPGTSETSFVVKRGEGLASVANRLEAADLITDGRLIRLKARLEGTENAIKAGTYTLAPGISAGALLEQLVAGEVVQYRLTIPEGLTTAQILKRVEAATDLTGDMPTDTFGEGTLLPDTYLFDAGTSRAQFVARMEKAQADLLDDLWPSRQTDLPISTPYEAVILASVVEKETGIAEERGVIAGLFTNRLRRGIRLQSDPTIIYGVSKGEPLYNSRGERRPIYRSEIDRKTDWNTYQIDGLPKTPICNPGRDAIAAVLNPPDTPYIFFVADGTGGHLFAETNEEHNRNVAAYRRYEREELARERSN